MLRVTYVSYKYNTNVVIPASDNLIKTPTLVVYLVLLLMMINRYASVMCDEPHTVRGC